MNSQVTQDDMDLALKSVNSNLNLDPTVLMYYRNFLFDQALEFWEHLNLNESVTFNIIRDLRFETMKHFRQYLEIEMDQHRVRQLLEDQSHPTTLSRLSIIEVPVFTEFGETTLLQLVRDQTFLTLRVKATGYANQIAILKSWGTNLTGQSIFLNHGTTANFLRRSPLTTIFCPLAVLG